MKEQLHVLIIVNRLFEWSQNFITRELVELNAQGVPMHIAARSIVERDDLTGREQQLLPLLLPLPENPFLPKYWVRQARAALRFFGGYMRAWCTLIALRHKPSKLFRSVICLHRALSVAQWVVAKKVNLIHAHFLTAPGDTALFLSVITGVPYGGTAHAMDIYTDNSGLLGKIAGAAYLTTCTAANARHLKSLPGVNAARITSVYHGIAVGAAEPAVKRTRRFTFLAVGRMVEKKGFRYLIEACGLLRDEDLDFQLNFVGNGPLEEELQSQVTALKLADWVHFKGFHPPNRMAGHYLQSDVLVVPSIVDAAGDRDGLPNVCLEAMNRGLPVIGSDVSGIPEGVISGRNGWLVPPADPKALAAAMKDAALTPRFSEMKKAARKMVVEKFSLETNIRALHHLMQSAVERNE